MSPTAPSASLISGRDPDPTMTPGLARGRGDLRRGHRTGATFETSPRVRRFDAATAEHRSSRRDGRVVGGHSRSDVVASVTPESPRAPSTSRKRARSRDRSRPHGACSRAPGGGSGRSRQACSRRTPRARSTRSDSLVGRFERIAQLDGVWRDTVLLELRLRSGGYRPAAEHDARVVAAEAERVGHRPRSPADAPRSGCSRGRTWDPGPRS